MHVVGPRVSADPADFTQVIREALPNHAILGEEGGVFGDTSSEYLWCENALFPVTSKTPVSRCIPRCGRTDRPIRMCAA